MKEGGWGASLNEKLKIRNEKLRMEGGGKGKHAGI